MKGNYDESCFCYNYSEIPDFLVYRKIEEGRQASRLAALCFEPKGEVDKQPHLIVLYLTMYHDFITVKNSEQIINKCCKKETLLEKLQQNE